MWYNNNNYNTFLLQVTLYNYHILFIVIWHTISPQKGTVARGKAEGYSTFHQGDNPEQNVTNIFLYYLTIHGDQLYGQDFGHVIWHMIVVNITRSEDRKDKRYVIIENVPVRQGMSLCKLWNYMLVSLL